MSINSFESPLFSQTYNIPTLRGYVANLPRSDVQKLEGEIYLFAIKEGVVVEKWDLEWGKNHLFESTARLVKVLFEKKKRELFNRVYSQQKVDLIFNHCPLVLENLLSNRADAELIRRANLITQLDALKCRLNEKYPELFLNASERDTAWRAFEVYHLTLPILMNAQDIRRFEYFTSIIEELLNGQYDFTGVEIILDKLLTKESLRPTTSDLSNYLRLKSLRCMTHEQVHTRSLQQAGESLWKSIKIIPSKENKQGKFKPLDIHSAMREVYGFRCDRMFGFGMTIPTELLSVEDIFQSISKVKELFVSAHAKFKQGNFVQAQLLRQHALRLFDEPHIPQEIRNSIFGETYFLCGNNQNIADLGRKLFYNSDGYLTSDLEKSIAIKNYFMSDAFKKQVAAFILQGTIQPWINDCARAYDLIVKDPAGGEKLKTAPKALAHLYALLGMIKGSMDCSSGNTFVEYSSELGRVVNFWDFDDERSMPTSAHFRDFRLWQLGLPQCAQPFDKALLLMFSNPMLIKQLQKQQTSLQISKAAYEEQVKRLEQIISIFQEELSHAQITLTPRDLFFRLFDGRHEYEDNKERTGISLIELFEFHLPGLNAWYTSEEDKKALIERNLQVLYLS